MMLLRYLAENLVHICAAARLPVTEKLNCLVASKSGAEQSYKISLVEYEKTIISANESQVRR